MSRDYITNEISKIIDSKEFEAPLDLAMSSAWILGNYKGINLKILDMTKTSSLSDYFVLASASNTTQAKAMADEISYQLKKRGQEFISKEGLNNSDWILLDSGDIITHIFLDSSRDVYGLEQLWAEAQSIKIPMNYYFSEENQSEDDSDKENRDFF